MAYPNDPLLMQEVIKQLLGGLEHLNSEDYDKLAQGIANAADPVRIALSAHEGATTRQIVEIFAAQIGLVLSAANKSFDSFRFVEAIERHLKRN